MSIRNINIGIVGDRYFIDKPYLEALMETIFDEEARDEKITDVTFVTGDCPTGVDYLVYVICSERHWKLIIEKVNRKQYGIFGNKLYFWRNERIVKQCNKVNIVVKKPYSGKGSILVAGICKRERVPCRWLEV